MVVEHRQQVVLAVLQRERPDHLVGARGVLDQQQQHVTVGEAHRLGAPERGGHGLQAGHDLGRRRAQRRRQRRGAQRVVHVVEAGERQHDLDRRGRQPQRDPGAAQAVEHHALAGDRRRWPRRAAAVAVVVAQVPQEHVVVAVRRAAAAAVLGVRGVLQTGQRHRRILDAEVHDVGAIAPEVGDQRVVGVEDQRGAGRLGHDARPAVGDDVQLAVAVELVAEQVGQQQRARADLRDELVEPELVDLEQTGVARDPPAGPRGLQQRARDPAGHVRARAVVHQLVAAALQDRRDHRRGRRLAVGRRDDRRPVRQPPSQRPDRVGLEGQQQLARQRRATAPGATGQRAGGARGGDLGSQQAHAPAGSRTWIAPGTARMVAGSSPIGSPSA